MDLNRAAVFVKVVEARGFSAAGRILGMPKTSVSKYVGDLETDLGVRLLNRTTRKVSLTEAGRRIYGHCLEGLRHMDAAMNEARILQSSPAGTLTVAAPAGIGVPFVMPIIMAFMEHYPDVTVTLLTIDDLVDLNEHQIEVMLWAGRETPPGHVIKLASMIDVGLFASTAYSEKHALPKDLNDLRHHQTVAFTHHLSGGRFVWDLHRKDKRVSFTPERTPCFSSNDPAAVLTAVRAGHGIGPLPVQYVNRVASGAGLLPVLPEWRMAPMALSALFRDGGGCSLAARLFRDFLADGFRDL